MATEEKSWRCSVCGYIHYGEFTPEKCPICNAKSEFRTDITFWGGGCDTVSILDKATPEEVRKHVPQCCKILAPGGGVVFNIIHNILPEVPAINIVAGFDAVKEFRR